MGRGSARMVLVGRKLTACCIDGMDLSEVFAQALLGCFGEVGDTACMIWLAGQTTLTRSVCTDARRLWMTYDDTTISDTPINCSLFTKPSLRSSSSSLKRLAHTPTKPSPKRQEQSEVILPHPRPNQVRALSRPVVLQLLAPCDLEDAVDAAHHPELRDIAPRRGSNPLP